MLNYQQYFLLKISDSRSGNGISVSIFCPLISLCTDERQIMQSFLRTLTKGGLYLLIGYKFLRERSTFEQFCIWTPSH